VQYIFFTFHKTMVYFNNTHLNGLLDLIFLRFGGYLIYSESVPSYLM
jgi:hypothetical protein